jgi:hypothetical protein
MVVSVAGFVLGTLGGATQSLALEPIFIHHVTPASACFPFSGAASLWGVNNGGNVYHQQTSTNLRLNCGVPFVWDITDEDFTWTGTVYYYDGNGTAASGEQYNMWCEGYSYPEGDQSYWYSTGRRWGCSTAGGCVSSPSSAFAGHGYISLPAFNNAELVKTISCSVPRFVSGQSGEITSLWIVENQN